MEFEYDKPPLFKENINVISKCKLFIDLIIITLIIISISISSYLSLDGNSMLSTHQIYNETTIFFFIIIIFFSISILISPFLLKEYSLMCNILLLNSIILSSIFIILLFFPVDISNFEHCIVVSFLVIFIFSHFIIFEVLTKAKLYLFYPILLMTFILFFPLGISNLPFLLTVATLDIYSIFILNSFRRKCNSDKIKFNDICLGEYFKN